MLMINIKKFKKKKLSIIIALNLCFTFSMAQNKLNISSIRFNFHVEMNKPNLDGTTSKLNNFLNLYFYKEFTLYEIPVYKTNTIVNGNADTITHETKITDSIDYYKYFIFKDGVDFGLEFDNLFDELGNKLEVSAYKRKFFNFADEMINNSNDLLKDKYRVNNTDIEEYTPKIKYDESYSDLTTLYFQKKFPKVNFSLSKKLDHERKSKLTKVMFTYLRESKQNPMKLMEFEIKSISLDVIDKKVAEFLIKNSAKL